MKDIIVIQNLNKRGVTRANMSDILLYEAMETKPRVLDKAPKRITLTKSNSIQAYGCCAEFCMQLNNLKAEIQLEQAKIDLRGNIRYCDVDVFIVLQTLIRESFTSNADRAAACFDVFRLIMTCPGDTITCGRVYEAIENYEPINYYANELIKAIKVCLYNETLPVVYWTNLCEFTGYYRNALNLGKDIIREKCKSEKEVEQFLRPIYKEAKEDEEFMSKIYQKGCNKWLLPMVYLLRKEHPEAMSIGTAGNGFV